MQQRVPSLHFRHPVKRKSNSEISCLQFLELPMERSIVFQQLLTSYIRKYILILSDKSEFSIYFLTHQDHYVFQGHHADFTNTAN